MFGRKSNKEVKEEKVEDSKPQLDERLIRILKEAEFIKSHVASQMGIKLEYNFACMLQIDLLIDRLLGGNPSEEPKQLAQIFGSYFGECVRRTFSGKWVFTEDNQAVLVDIGGTDIKVIPHNTLHSRICDNEEQKVFVTSQFIAQKLIQTYSETLYKKKSEQGGAGNG